MTRHPFRWDALAFGAFFLAITGNWIAWKQDVLTLDELSVAAPVALIAIGAIGIVATILPRKGNSDAEADEEADTQH